MELEDTPVGYALVYKPSGEMFSRLYLKIGNAKAARTGYAPSPYHLPYKECRAAQQKAGEELYDIRPVYFKKD